MQETMRFPESQYEEENGKGEMLLQGDDALVAKVAEKYNLSPLDLEAFKHF